MGVSTHAVVHCGLRPGQFIKDRCRNNGMELTVDVDAAIHDSLTRRAEKNGFESTEAYCETILELVVEELEGDQRSEQVEQRLEDLGYLS